MLKKIKEAVTDYFRDMKELITDNAWEIKRAWGDYELYRYNAVGKVIAAITITLMNLLYTIVLGVSVTVLVLAMLFVFPPLLPLLWLLAIILTFLMNLTLKKGEKL